MELLPKTKPIKSWLTPKTLEVMKLASVLVMAFTFQVSATVTSQTVTFTGKNVAFKKVLSVIKKQTNYVFFYDVSILKDVKPVSIEATNMPIEKVLKEAFKDEPFVWVIEGKTISFMPKTETLKGNLKSEAIQKKIKGSVVDEKGIPVPGANVQVVGTTIAVQTDFDGNFVIEVPDNKAKLSVTFMGFVSQEVTAGNDTLKIVLREKDQALEEVVVVGYGKQKKVNATGAVATIKFEDMANSRPMVNVSSALGGLASGVNVRQSNGRPGSDGASIRIRGIGTLDNSNPLVIIDGFEGSMDLVNPQDIESISILKDAASASIYGSRAANGVVLITTKKGSAKKTSVTYNGLLSVNQPVKLLGFINDYPRYMRLMNEGARNIGVAENFSQATIAAWEEANKNPNALNANGVPNYIAFPNTDWNKAIYKDALIKNHTLSVSGGGSNSRYLMSGSYLDNAGLVDNTGLKRASFRTNLEVDVNKWWTLGTRTYVMATRSDLGNYSSVLNFIQQTTPGVYPVYNNKYGFPEAPEESATANNISSYLHSINGYDKDFMINGALYSKVKLFKGMSWEVNYNHYKLVSELQNHDNPEAAARYKFSNGTQAILATAPSQLTTRYVSSFQDRNIIENLLKYETTIADKHEISALAGINSTRFSSYNHAATKRGLVDESVYAFDAANEMVSITGNGTDWGLLSYFGRLNYIFDKKYSIETSWRYDGSSRFAKDSRYGLFPSVSAGWRISEEKFMQNFNFFKSLKLRASWGQLGNNATVRPIGTDDNYAYQSLYSTVGYSLNGAVANGLAVQDFPNSSLQWEKTTSSNIGIDAVMFDGKLAVDLDYYSRVTDDILTQPTIPLTAGTVNAPVLNTAQVTNKGLEMSATWNHKIGNVKYSISANGSYNKNEVTAFKGKLIQEWRTDASGNQYYFSNLGQVSSGGQNRIVEGHSINEHYLLDVYSGDGTYTNTDGSVNSNGGPKDGMIRTPADLNWLQSMVSAGYSFQPNNGIGKNKIWYGDLIYADKNGDKIYGNVFDNSFKNASVMPKFTFGSRMNVSWKNFDLNLIWSGQLGGKIYWNERGYNSSVTRIGFQVGQLVANDHYYYNDSNPTDSANNINALYPRLKQSESDNQNSIASTRWLYDGSYLRLTNLTFGYTLPKNLSAKVYADQLRLFLTGSNLLTLTSFPGLDPEMGGNSNYPLLRQLAFGLNVSF